MYSKQLRANKIPPQSVDCGVMTSSSKKVLPPVTRQPPSTTDRSSRTRTTKTATIESEYAMGSIVGRARRTGRPVKRSLPKCTADRNTARGIAVGTLDDDEEDDVVDDISHRTTVEILSNILSRRRQTSDVIVRTTSRSQKQSTNGFGYRPQRTVSVLPLQNLTTHATDGFFDHATSTGEVRHLDHFGVLDVIPPIKKHPSTTTSHDGVGRITDVGDVDVLNTSKMALQAMQLGVGGGDATAGELDSFELERNAVSPMADIPTTGGENSDKFEYADSDDDDENITAISITMSNRATANSSVAGRYSSVRNKQRSSYGLRHVRHHQLHSEDHPSTCRGAAPRHPASRTDGLIGSSESRRHDDDDAILRIDHRSILGRFSVAEWNRQKVLHLRRASLRRTCLDCGPPQTDWRSAGTAEKQTSTTTTSQARHVQPTDHNACGTRPTGIGNGATASKFISVGYPRSSSNDRKPQQQKQQLPHHMVSTEYSRQKCAKFPPPTPPHREGYYQKHSPLPRRFQQPPDDFLQDTNANHTNAKNTLHQTPDIILAELEKVTSALQLQQQQQQQQQCGVKNADHEERTVLGRDDTQSEDRGGNDKRVNRADNVQLLLIDASVEAESKTVSSCCDDGVKMPGAMKGSLIRRKSSLMADGERRGSTYVGRCFESNSRRTTLTDCSKSSTPALLEPQETFTDFSRPVSSWSSIAVDEITSLPGSPFYNRQVLQRRSSSIDSGMSRPGSDFLDVPILLVQARDRSPSMIDSTETTSSTTVDSPMTESSPVIQINEDGHSVITDLQQQVLD